jgi:hypothetical protein
LLLQAVNVMIANNHKMQRLRDCRDSLSERSA